MSRLSLLLVSCVFLWSAITVKAAEDPLADALDSASDNRLWRQMIASLGIVADDKATHATMFAPTDRAVENFLDGMGLTFQELLARPVLVDSILSYHLVPGVSVEDFFINNKYDGNKELISSNPEQPTEVLTGDVNDAIMAYKSPTTGLVNLVDVQGNRAVVVGEKVQSGDIVFYDITAVLMSSSYFFRATDAIRYYPDLSGASDLFSKASLYSEGLSKSVKGASENTFLLPTNDALGGAAKALAAVPAADLAQVLEYHVVPGLKTVPKGWQNDAAVNTLLSGQKITAKVTNITAQDPYTGSNSQVPQLTLVSSSGGKSRVLTYNIFAGKSVLMSLDAPLLPKIPAVAKLTAASSSGRKLLQRSRSSRRDSNSAATNTQAAIRAAARGTVPVSYATSAGSRNAQRAGCVNCQRWGW